MSEFRFQNLRSKEQFYEQKIASVATGNSAQLDKKQKNELQALLSSLVRIDGIDCNEIVMVGRSERIISQQYG